MKMTTTKKASPKPEAMVESGFQPSKTAGIQWGQKALDGGIALLVTFVGGMAVALIAKDWAENKIQQVMSQRVEAPHGQAQGVQGNFNELNQSIKNLSDNVRIMGDKNLVASMKGDGVINQSFTETKTDFKQDTPQSEVVVEQIAQGLGIYNGLLKDGVTVTEVAQLESALVQWVGNTAQNLNKVSKKASVYFQNADTTGPGMSYSGNQRAGELRAVTRKYLNSLNDILRNS